MIMQTRLAEPSRRASAGSLRLQQSHLLGLPVPTWLRQTQGGARGVGPVTADSSRMGPPLPTAASAGGVSSASAPASGDATAIFTVCDRRHRSSVSKVC